MKGADSNTPLADHLAERLGYKVVLVTSKDFDTFWKGVEEQKYDLVHFNQYHYIRSAQTYKVIAHAQEFCGQEDSGRQPGFAALDA